MPDPAGRQYSEAEMRAIFERAARAQHAADAPQGGGLSLRELQEVGAASGIAPEHIAAAAASVGVEAPAPRGAFGLPRVVRRSRVLPGPVADEAWGEVVSVLRQQFGGRGTAEQVGRVRSWTSEPQAGAGGYPRSTHVEIIPRADGRTEAVVEHKGLYANGKGLLWGGAVGGVSMPFLSALFAFGDFDPAVWLLPALLLVMSVGMVAWGVLWTQAEARRLERGFEATLDRLELIALQGARSEALEAERPAPALASLLRPGEEASRPSLALPPEADAPDAEASAQPVRSRAR